MYSEEQKQNLIQYIKDYAFTFGKYYHTGFAAERKTHELMDSPEEFAKDLKLTI